MREDELLPRSTLCPACGARLDSAYDVDQQGYRPQPGDASFCLGCTSLLVFDEDEGGLLLRFPTDDELLHYSTDKKLHKVRSALLQAFRETE